MTPGVTVVIPTIPTRRKRLARALASVKAQTRLPEASSIEVDGKHEGAGPTRTRALRRVETEFAAFLDDDDHWYPQHLELLLAAAEEQDADVVYPWFDVVDVAGRKQPRWDPFPQFEGKPWDPAEPHMFPICALVRTELAQQSAFPAPPPGTTDPLWGGDDWPFWCGVFELGAKVYHLNERTWAYHHWGFGKPGVPGNTSGCGARW